jgi:hypothetical protein
MCSIGPTEQDVESECLHFSLRKYWKVQYNYSNIFQEQNTVQQIWSYT